MNSNKLVPGKLYKLYSDTFSIDSNKHLRSQLTRYLEQNYINIFVYVLYDKFTLKHWFYSAIGELCWTIDTFQFRDV